MEVSWGRLGGILSRHGGVFEASWAILEASWGVLEASWGLLTAQRRPQRLQDGPRGAQDSPGGAQDSPGGAQDSPKGAQESPRSAQDGHMRLPKRPRDPPPESPQEASQDPAITTSERDPSKSPKSLKHHHNLRPQSLPPPASKPLPLPAPRLAKNLRKSCNFNRPKAAFRQLSFQRDSAFSPPVGRLPDFQKT